MNVCFGDTSYFIALLSARDQYHEAALALSRKWRGVIVTTQWILTELADGFSDNREARGKVVRFVDVFARQSSVVIVPATDDWFSKGWQLFEAWPGKGWSLTDCISFAVMTERGIREALTADRHFEQAGFAVLLDEG